MVRGVRWLVVVYADWCMRVLVVRSACRCVLRVDVSCGVAVDVVCWLLWIVVGLWCVLRVAGCVVLCVVCWLVLGVCCAMLLLLCDVVV